MQALWELDQSVFRTIHLGWHRDWLDPVFFVISSTGLGWVQVLAILGLLPWRRGWRIRRADWRPYAGPLLLAFLVSSILNTGILKKVIERDRPSNLADAIPQETFFYNSFPSGHTASSFGIAMMAVYLTWGTDRAWIGRWAMVWACLVGLSRIYRGVHWPSDVLGGALVGIGAASLVALMLKPSRIAPSSEISRTDPA
ncbi:MAG TPA: phosphatase PAP2 family protein [Fimbriimonadaceae bacterium]|nr:phosphatase PAP2 family protein [Fimbriimonadaceae bacterium]